MGLMCITLALTLTLTLTLILTLTATLTSAAGEELLDRLVACVWRQRLDVHRALLRHGKVGRQVRHRSHRG